MIDLINRDVIDLALLYTAVIDLANRDVIDLAILYSVHGRNWLGYTRVVIDLVIKGRD